MDGPRRYRKRPIEVSAIQWTGENMRAVRDFYMEAPGRRAGFAVDADGRQLLIWVEKIDQDVAVPVGHWIIAERDGVGMYPCTPAEFDAIYEPVE